MSYNTPYDIHRTRIELEKISRDNLHLSTSQNQSQIMSSLDRRLSQLSSSFNNLGYSVQDVKYSMQENMKMNTKATVGAIESIGNQFSKAFETTGSEIVSTLKYFQQSTSEGFHYLGAIFSHGISQIVWHLEQTNKQLIDILATLKSPRKTEADELRERGNELFKNGLIARFPEDREKWMKLSLEAYMESIEKNPVDFSAFYSIGTIQFFEIGNAPEAISYFRSAVSFAEPYSSYHAALSWLNLGYIYRCQNEFVKAHEATLEALRLEPYWAEIWFQCSVYSGLIKNFDLMKSHLNSAIRMDRNYWFRATTEPDFIPLVSKVAEILNDIRQKKLEEVEKVFSDENGAIGELSDLIKKVRELELPAHKSLQIKNEAEELLKKVERLKSKGTYFELLEALSFKDDILWKCRDSFEALSNEAGNEINRIENEIENQLKIKRNDIIDPIKTELHDRISKLDSQKNGLNFDVKRLSKENTEERASASVMIAIFFTILTLIGQCNKSPYVIGGSFAGAIMFGFVLFILIFFIWEKHHNSIISSKREKIGHLEDEITILKKKLNDPFDNKTSELFNKMTVNIRKNKEQLIIKGAKLQSILSSKSKF